MTSKYDPREHGPESQRNPADDALRQAWALCAKQQGNERREGRWIPVRSVYVDHTDNPRGVNATGKEANLDHDHVAYLKEIGADLDPIGVNQSFRLFDGNHRLHARYDASIIFARIFEIPDEEVWLHAYRANVNRAKWLTPEDKERHVKRLAATFPGRSIGWYATEARVNERTVRKYVRDDQGVQSTPPDTLSERVVGKDGKSYPKTGGTRQGVQSTPPERSFTDRTSPSPVRSFDPGAESEPDDPFYDNDAASQGVGTEWEPQNLTPLDPPAEVPAVDTGAVKWADSAPEIPEGMSAEEAELFGYGKHPAPTYMRKPDVYEPLSAAQADFLVASFERIAKRALWIDRDWYGLTTEQRGRVRACIDESFTGMSALMQELKSAAVGGS